MIPKYCFSFFNVYTKKELFNLWGEKALLESIIFTSSGINDT